MLNWSEILESQFRKRAPATDESIADFEAKAGVKLPASYIQFVKLHNGYSGLVGKAIVMFDCIEEILDGFDYYIKMIPHFIPFASDGGGEYFVFDYRHSPPAVRIVNAVGYDDESAIKVGEDFENFISNCIKYESLFDVPRSL